jgi:hypothetical protein
VGVTPKDVGVTPITFNFLKKLFNGDPAFLTWPQCVWESSLAAGHGYNIPTRVQMAKLCSGRYSEALWELRRDFVGVTPREKLFSSWL